MNLILKIAWRNLWRNKMRSILIMISTVIGILAGLSVLGLYKGMMKSRIKNVIESEVGHLQIHHSAFKKDYNPIYTIPNADQILIQINKLSEVKITGGRTVIQGMLVSSTGSAGIQINGIEPNVEYKMSSLGQKIIEGKQFDINKKNQVLIGMKLSEKMKLKPGQKIILTFTDKENNIISAAFRICGIYKTDNMQLDEVNAYVNINTLNELLSTEKTINEIVILIHNDNDLEIVKGKLKNIFSSLMVESWKDISPESDLLVKTVDEYSYIIIIIILIALAFGIINTMMMSVLERTREIGMMVALGMSKARIFFLVMTETLLLAIIGTPIGFASSFLIIKHYQKTGLDLSGMGEEMMASFGFNTLIYPTFPWENIITIITMIIFVALISCIIPALKVLRLIPIEALRQ